MTARAAGCIDPRAEWQRVRPGRQIFKQRIKEKESAGALEETNAIPMNKSGREVKKPSAAPSQAASIEALMAGERQPRQLACVQGELLSLDPVNFRLPQA
ncbi:hypothetical protein [Paracidovorax citrulli]